MFCFFKPLIFKIDSDINNERKTRKSFSNLKKLEIVRYAETHGNAETSRKFGVDESNIRRWRKQKFLIEVMNPRKRTRRSRKEFWPE